MPVNGTWENELQSVLTLNVDHTADIHDGAKLHRLSGTFVNGAGDGTDPKEQFPVTGVAIEDANGEILVTFQVVFPPTADFPHRGSICNWSGRLLRDKHTEKLFTVWTLAFLADWKRDGQGQAVREPTQRWNHTLTNADTFTKS